MYAPREDSFFLSETLPKFFENKHVKGKKFLDMGSGTGIQAETLTKFSDKKDITCADIDKEAIKYLESKGFHAIHSDLFSKVKGKFDFIVFNPPYLPEHKHDKQLDTSGGKLGDEIILKFLKQSKKHIKKDGKIFLLISSLTPKNRIYHHLEKNYKFKIVAEKSLFFEKLEILVIGLSL